MLFTYKLTHFTNLHAIDIINNIKKRIKSVKIEENKEASYYHIGLTIRPASIFLQKVLPLRMLLIAIEDGNRTVVNITFKLAAISKLILAVTSAILIVAETFLLFYFQKWGLPYFVLVVPLVVVFLIYSVSYIGFHAVIRETIDKLGDK